MLDKCSPDAVIIMLPPPSVFPLAVLAFPMAVDACLIARKTLGRMRKVQIEETATYDKALTLIVSMNRSALRSFKWSIVATPA